MRFLQHIYIYVFINSRVHTMLLPTFLKIYHVIVLYHVLLVFLSMSILHSCEAYFCNVLNFVGPRCSDRLLPVQPGTTNGTYCSDHSFIFFYYLFLVDIGYYKLVYHMVYLYYAGLAVCQTWYWIEFETVFMISMYDTFDT